MALILSPRCGCDGGARVMYEKIMSECTHLDAMECNHSRVSLPHLRLLRKSGDDDWIAD
jgi:hypothetical protein